MIKGIVEGCVQAGAALIGGETAEMPGMYAEGDYDLAGFCVGIVEKDAIIDGSRTRPGDVVIGLPSSGPHSNGYSLIRKLHQDGESNAGDETRRRGLLYDALLAPTRIYVKPLLALAKEVPVRSFAHITGGGLTENIPRVHSRRARSRPERADVATCAGVRLAAARRRHRRCGDVSHVQLRHRHDGRALRPNTPTRRCKSLHAHGEQPVVIGEVRRGDGGVIIRG